MGIAIDSYTEVMSLPYARLFKPFIPCQCQLLVLLRSGTTALQSPLLIGVFVEQFLLDVFPGKVGPLPNRAVVIRLFQSKNRPVTPRHPACFIAILPSDEIRVRSWVGEFQPREMMLKRLHMCNWPRRAPIIYTPGVVPSQRERPGSNPIGLHDRGHESVFRRLLNA